MTDLEYEEAIVENNPEIAEQHYTAELEVFPSMKDRVNVLTRLKLLGIKEVVVEFSGGGDSGEIEDVWACNYQGDRVDLSQEKIEGWANKSDFDTENHKWVERVERCETTLDELLENICNNALEKSGHDWYNNDGGQGNLTIDLSQTPPRIHLDVSINYTSTEDHEYNL